MGNVNAMIKLGVWYAEGDFDTQDKVNAILWFQQAVDLYKTHNQDYTALHEDEDNIQQAKEQFIELVQQADETGQTDVITKLGIHWLDGVDTELYKRMMLHPMSQACFLNRAYAIIHLTMPLKKENSARQDTNPTELIQRAHAIQESVFKIAQKTLFGDVEPSFIIQWGIQVVPEFSQQLCRITFTIARFMLEQLKKE